MIALIIIAALIAISVTFAITLLDLFFAGKMYEDSHQDED